MEYVGEEKFWKGFKTEPSDLVLYHSKVLSQPGRHDSDQRQDRTQMQTGQRGRPDAEKVTVMIAYWQVDRQARRYKQADRHKYSKTYFVTYLEYNKRQLNN